ncbi:unannotated protein [freshwater metagenome]|uniref:Unannotated protein n=1 Tax=freshwater metagenome TaxID=449393 RepID=A0A6J6SRL1_9ZZZZ
MIGVAGSAAEMRGLSLMISGWFQVVIAPAKIFARVTCLSWIDEPRVRPVVAFFRLIGTVIAPPMFGMYSQSKVGSPEEYLESVCAKTNVPFEKLPLPVPEPVEVYWIVKSLCDALKSAAHCERKTYGNDAPPPATLLAAFAGAASATVEATRTLVATIARVRRTVSPLSWKLLTNPNVGAVSLRSTCFR